MPAVLQDKGGRYLKGKRSSSGLPAPSQLQRWDQHPGELWGQSYLVEPGRHILTLMRPQHGQGHHKELQWGSPPPIRGSDVDTPVGLKVGLLSQGAWKAEYPPKRVYSCALRSHGACLARFWTYLALVNSFFFLFLLFGIRTSILCLSHHYILELCNFFGFSDSQLDRNCLWLNSNLSLTSVDDI